MPLNNEAKTPLLNLKTTENELKWSTIVSPECFTADLKNNIQFVHPIYQMHQAQSDLFFELLPILKPKLKFRQFVRIKANCTLCTSESIIHGLHTDINHFDNTGLKTAIFYLNTNNGFTIFEDKTKVNSVENRMIVFPASMKHSGATCTDTKERLVINFNFF